MSTETVTKFIKDLGFPVAVALMLLLALMGWLPSPILTNIEEQTKALKRHMGRDVTRDILLWNICRSTVRSAGGNPDDCVKPWEGPN
jgi:hypothetical protein